MTEQFINEGTAADHNVQVYDSEVHSTSDKPKKSTYLPDNAGNIMSTAFTHKDWRGERQIVTVGNTQMDVDQAARLGFIKKVGDQYVDIDQSGKTDGEPSPSKDEPSQNQAPPSDFSFDKEATNRISTMKADLDAMGVRIPSLLSEYVHNIEKAEALGDGVSDDQYFRAAMPEMLKPLVESGQYTEADIVNGLHSLEQDMERHLTQIWKEMGIKDCVEAWKYITSKTSAGNRVAAFSAMITKQDPSMFLEWGRDYLMKRQ